MLSTIDLLRIKIERAKKHIEDLNLAHNIFLASNPYELGTKIDPHTGDHIFYLVRVDDVPLSLAAIVGDILHNLRSTLDNLAYQLFIIGRPGGDAKHVYFPIFGDAAKYKAGVKGKVHGMRQEAIDAIDAVKPYKGGDEMLWRLHALNNRDKHRLLIIAASSYRFHSMTPSQRAKYGDPDSLRGVFIKPAVGTIVLKAGTELIRLPKSEVEDDLKFNILIAFHEPGIIEGESVIETLKGMADRVDDIISNFASLLT